MRGKSVFRSSGDMLHTLLLMAILERVISKQNAQGISRKTQELLLMVSALRYLDLFTTFYSFYNTFMKLFYIAASALILIIMYHEPVRSTYSADQDTLKHWWGIFAPSAILGISTVLYSRGTDHFDLIESCWTISIILEAVALLPQAIMYRKYRRVESLMGGAILLMGGGYRGLYALNWFYRAHTEPHYRHHYLVYVCGVIQFFVGIGGICCCIGQGGTAPLGPQLVQWYRGFKLGWIITAIIMLFMAAESGNMAYKVSNIRSEEDRQRVMALIILSVVGVLVLICYCGFSTHQVVEEAAEKAEDETGLLEQGEGDGSNDDDKNNNDKDGASPKEEGRSKKIIKKGIFIHGIQVV